MPVQGLDANPIARQHQPARARVPPRQGKHSVEFPQRPLGTPVAQGSQDHFRVAVRSKAVGPLSFEFPAQLHVVVHLPIQHKDVLTNLEGLIRARRGVQNAEPQMAERHHHPLVPQSFCVGTTMRQRLHHRAQRGHRLGPT